MYVTKQWSSFKINNVVIFIIETTTCHRSRLREADCRQIINKKLKNFDHRLHYRGGGGIFTGVKLMWHWPDKSNAVSCSSRADAVIDFLLHTQQQCVTMLFNGPDNTQNCPFPLGDLDPPSNAWFLGPTRITQPNGILIGSSVFARHTNVTKRHTYRQTTLLRL